MGILLPFRRFAGAALDLLAPPACLACGAPEMGELSLCSACVRRIPPPPPDPCPRCAAPVGPGADPTGCGDCGKLRPRFESAVAAAPYAGFVGELIRRAKYGRDPLLAVPLAGLVRRALRGATVPAPDLVLPVPAHPARAAERGFHLADLLAAAAAEELGAEARDDCLARTGDPTPQAARQRTERLRAARGTVALVGPRRLRLPWTRRPDPAGKSILVVDDVLTTGATVNECARVLLRSGAREVRVVVAARA